jgi:hypothetical protein
MNDDKKSPSFESMLILDVMLTQLRLSMNISRIADNLGVDLVPPHLDSDMSSEERKIRIREVKFARLNIEKLGVPIPPEMEVFHSDYIAGNTSGDKLAN